MVIKPLPKTPKMPTSISSDGGALLIRTLFDNLTDIATAINQLIEEQNKIKDHVGMP